MTKRTTYQTLDEFLDAIHRFEISVVHLYIHWKEFSHPVRQTYCRTPVKTTLAAYDKNFNESDGTNIHVLEIEHQEVYEHFDGDKSYANILKKRLYIEGLMVVDGIQFNKDDVQEVEDLKENIGKWLR